jgi:hypothetical protein
MDNGKHDWELDTSDIEQQDDYEGDPDPTPDPNGWDEGEDRDN